MFDDGTVMLCGLSTPPSLQLTNVHPFEAIAVNTTLLPTRKTPLPVTEPPTLVLLLTVIVTGGTKFNCKLLPTCVTDQMPLVQPASPVVVNAMAVEL